MEELLTRPIESDAQCQTDLFLHRPPTPPHIVSSTKLVNAETQVLDGELFDFDSEVEPLLEMMVGRTVEQSLLEVLNEEEFSDLRKQQQEFLTIREAELADLKRLQNKEYTPQDDKVCLILYYNNIVEMYLFLEMPASSRFQWKRRFYGHARKSNSCPITAKSCGYSST